jgi:hypothetical protein
VTTAFDALSVGVAVVYSHVALVRPSASVNVLVAVPPDGGVTSVSSTPG